MGLMNTFTVLVGILLSPIYFFESIVDKIIVIAEPDTRWKENLWYLGVSLA